MPGDLSRHDLRVAWRCAVQVEAPESPGRVREDVYG